MNQAITLPPPPYNQPPRTGNRYGQLARYYPSPPTGVLDKLFWKSLENPANRLAKALWERTPEDLAQLIIALHRAENLCLHEDELMARCAWSFYKGFAP